MPTKTTPVIASPTAAVTAAPVKSPTSTKQTSGRSGRSARAARSVRPPVQSTTVGSPWAAITCTACTTLARHDAVENGRTIPVVPRIEMPPRMPSRRLVVLRAMISPRGTLITTRTPTSLRSTTSATASPIIRRGVSLIAGPPTASPRPGLVTVPTPAPPASRRPGTSVQFTVAVSSAPWVTSGSSPASLTTTASARTGGVPVTSQRSTGKRTRRPAGSPISTSCWVVPVTRAVTAALAAAVAHAPVVQPVRSAVGRTFAVRGRSGSRSGGSAYVMVWLSPRCGRLPGGAARRGRPARRGGRCGSARGGRGASGCPRRRGPDRPGRGCASTACAA
ncbi:hypothetical protein ONO23_00477 [Micromonospora noduli]|nr:hypothetical protein ONO23_00477 [Micromonospora noduli]